MPTAHLIVYLAGQATFHKRDFYEIDRKVYANPRDGKGFTDLYELTTRDGTVKKLNLIGRDAAGATSPDTACGGYWFVDITGDADGPYEYESEFGLAAMPAEQGNSWQHTYIIDHRGTIYMRVNGGKPVRTWPDVSNDGWIAVGNAGVERRSGVGLAGR